MLYKWLDKKVPFLLVEGFYRCKLQDDLRLTGKTLQQHYVHTVVQRIQAYLLQAKMSNPDIDNVVLIVEGI